MASDLISRKAVVEAILAERDKILLEVPSKHTQSMRGDIRKALRCVETAPAVDAVEVVRCFECVKRGNSIECPMCHDEAYEDDGGYNEWYTYDNTDDEGFCHRGVKKDAD